MKFCRKIEKPKGVWETKKPIFSPKFPQHKTEADLEPAISVLRPLCYTFSTDFFMIFHHEHYELLKRFLKKVLQIILMHINVEEYLHSVALSS